MQSNLFNILKQFIGNYRETDTSRGKLKSRSENSFAINQGNNALKTSIKAINFHSKCASGKLK